MAKAARKRELMVVLDFGGQYNQLIARRIRDAGAYCEVLPYTTPVEELRERAPKGIIFTGGPRSVNEPGAPRCPAEVFELGVPILGICYGSQLIAVSLGGKVANVGEGEYGATELRLADGAGGKSALLSGVGERSTCWMSHMDSVTEIPEGFRGMAQTNLSRYAAYENPERAMYAVQFHPEVMHTEFGRQILRNFTYGICRFAGDWEMSSFAEEAVAALRERIGDKKVLCALSGGVDSTVAAVLVHKAVGRQLTSVFVDHGLMRKGEADSVENVCRGRFNMNFVRVNAKERFLGRLEGVSEPEKKRRIIGEEFIRVFEEEAKRIGQVDWLVQGTIYPDVIESGLGDAAVIKSHHNVGALPKDIGFSGIIEPLRLLFKDEVRRVGLEIGVPEDIVWRQPFPGPGLAVRVLGAITEEKLEIVREADAIFREEVAAAGLERGISQYFAALPDIRSVGVKGDERSYDYAVALRAVTTDDFMTADFCRIPYDTLARVSSRIVNEVAHVNRVVYDITAKPPSTIEWE